MKIMVCLASEIKNPTIENKISVKNMLGEVGYLEVSTSLTTLTLYKESEFTSACFSNCDFKICEIASLWDIACATDNSPFR